MKRLTLTLSGLVGVAILAAVVWRVELEVNGWGGLAWLEYFHWAVPAGALMFMVWLALVVPIPSIVDRAVFLAATAYAAVMWYAVALFALVSHFNAGPSAFVNMMLTGETRYHIYATLIYAVVPLTPVVFAILLSVFGARPSVWQLTVSLAVYLLACPVSIALLALVDHPGGPDAIHTIKSGFIIPFLIAGLGILAIDFGRTRQSQQANPAHGEAAGSCH